MLEGTIHDHQVNWERSFHWHLDKFQHQLCEIVASCVYLTQFESKKLLNEIKQSLERIKSFADLNERRSELNSNVPSQRTSYGVRLDGAKSALVHILLKRGVYVAIHLANKYPWNEISELFGDTNSDSLINDYYEQAAERSAVMIGVVSNFIPYPEHLLDLHREIMGKWTKTRETIETKYGQLRPKTFSKFTTVAEHSLYWMFDNLLTVSVR